MYLRLLLELDMDIMSFQLYFGLTNALVAFMDL